MITAALLLVTYAARGFVSADDLPTQRRTASLLLLTNGRTVTGIIDRSVGGYMITKPNGRMLVPFEQVRLQADNLTDAYHKQRNSIVKPTASDHIALARWCLAYELYQEARGELEDALILEPQRLLSQRMLRRVVEQLEGPQPVPMPADRPVLNDDGFELPPPKSLSGLPREAAHDFVSKIQPILMNKCGNASCHGPHVSNGLRLTRVRIGRGANRVHSERNLALVLEFIDLQNPADSRLLREPQNKDGAHRQPIFAGSSGEQQLETLRQWVVSLASRTPAPPRLLSALDDDQQPISQASQVMERGPQGPVNGRSNRSTTQPTNNAAAVLIPPVDPKTAFIHEMLRKKAGDPFDPDVFNRQYHPTLQR